MGLWSGRRAESSIYSARFLVRNECPVRSLRMVGARRADRGDRPLPEEVSWMISLISKSREHTQFLSLVDSMTLDSNQAAKIRIGAN